MKASLFSAALVSSATCQSRRHELTPDCAFDCAQNLTDQHLQMDMDTICESLGMQRALFRCLIGFCKPQHYGQALAYTISTCSSVGATIGYLHPVEVHQTRLAPRQSFQKMTRSGKITAPPAEDDKQIQFDHKFLLSVDCSAGDNGILTLSIPSSTSATELPSIDHRNGQGSSFDRFEDSSHPDLVLSEPPERNLNSGCQPELLTATKVPFHQSASRRVLCPCDKSTSSSWPSTAEVWVHPTSHLPSTRSSRATKTSHSTTYCEETSNPVNTTTLHQKLSYSRTRPQKTSTFSFSELGYPEDCSSTTSATSCSRTSTETSLVDRSEEPCESTSSSSSSTTACATSTIPVLSVVHKSSSCVSEEEMTTVSCSRASTSSIMSTTTHSALKSSSCPIKSHYSLSSTLPSTKNKLESSSISLAAAPVSSRETKYSSESLSSTSVKSSMIEDVPVYLFFTTTSSTTSVTQSHTVFSTHFEAPPAYKPLLAYTYASPLAYGEQLSIRPYASAMATVAAETLSERYSTRPLPTLPPVYGQGDDQSAIPPTVTDDVMRNTFFDHFRLLENRNASTQVSMFFSETTLWPIPSKSSMTVPSLTASANSSLLLSVHSRTPTGTPGQNLGFMDDKNDLEGPVFITVISPSGEGETKTSVLTVWENNPWVPPKAHLHRHRNTIKENDEREGLISAAEANMERIRLRHPDTVNTPVVDNLVAAPFAAIPTNATANAGASSMPTPCFAWVVTSLMLGRVFAALRLGQLAPNI